MHSSKFTALAQRADEMGCVVAGTIWLPAKPGLREAAAVLLWNPDTQLYSTHLAMWTEDGARPELRAILEYGDYDLAVGPDEAADALREKFLRWR